MNGNLLHPIAWDFTWMEGWSSVINNERGSLKLSKVSPYQNLGADFSLVTDDWRKTAPRWICVIKLGLLLLWLTLFRLLPTFAWGIVPDRASILPPSSSQPVAVKVRRYGRRTLDGATEDGAAEADGDSWLLSVWMTSAYVDDRVRRIAEDGGCPHAVGGLSSAFCGRAAVAAALDVSWRNGVRLLPTTEEVRLMGGGGFGRDDADSIDTLRGRIDGRPRSATIETTR